MKCHCCLWSNSTLSRVSTFPSTVSTKTLHLSRMLQKVQKEAVSCWEPTMNGKLGFQFFQFFSSES